MNLFWGALPSAPVVRRVAGIIRGMAACLTFIHVLMVASDPGTLNETWVGYLWLLLNLAVAAVLYKIWVLQRPGARFCVMLYAGLGSVLVLPHLAALGTFLDRGAAGPVQFALYGLSIAQVAMLASLLLHGPLWASRTPAAEQV